jgi:hypothetical protein
MFEIVCLLAVAAVSYAAAAVPLPNLADLSASDD